MKPLQAVDQHRSVRFLEHVVTHFDLVVGPNGHQVRVEGRVMKRAERDAVWHGRGSKRVTVTNDVSGL
jgi:hypothetical protein